SESSVAVSISSTRTLSKLETMCESTSRRDRRERADPHPSTSSPVETELAPNAFPLDSLGFDVYTFPTGRRWEPVSFLDPLEGTEIKDSGEGGVHSRTGPTGSSPIQ